MLFNSLDFAIFLPLVFVAYWVIASYSIGLRNLFVLFASYVFYGWWDWRFLSLLLFSTVVDYLVGLGFEKYSNMKLRKGLLGVSLFTNLGLLGFFKYYNFFIDSFVDSFLFFGYNFNADRLDVVLPVGISFYTFQTLSYSIDVFRKDLKASRSFIDFAAFVSFFPQLVAGPIERATNLLPQFSEKKTFNYVNAVNGSRQILWGLFKKMVVADGCSFYVDQAFGGDISTQSGSNLLLGVVLFAFQIYGDFSGYSDIAIGVSKLFGFELMRNFAYPYFSRDVAEFWRRWHISLSTWFRDYLYLPLGGSRGAKVKVIRNTMVIFLVSGFWHGANWTFVVWGALNAIYFLPLLLSGNHRKHTDHPAEETLLPSLRTFIKMLSTFFLICLSWVFFRAESISDALTYLRRIFSPSLFTVPTNLSYVVLFMIIIQVLLEWIGRKEQHPLVIVDRIKYPVIRWGVYFTFVMLISMFFVSNKSFIYFQF